MNLLTIDDFDFKGKTVFLRVDINCPIDPETLEISGTKRIEEVVETINSLNDAKIVIASHQGRVGNKDYTGMENRQLTDEIYVHLEMNPRHKSLTS